VKFLFLTLLFTQLASARVLVVTDSHGEGAFGTRLVELFEKNGDVISFYGVGGSTSKDWMLGLDQIWGYWEYHTDGANIRSQKPKTPEFKNLLIKLSPKKVIIELGTNLIWRDLSLEDAKFIQDMIRLASEFKAECFWVGPPDLRPKSSEQKRRVLEIHELLKKEVEASGCQLIKSWELTQFPATGGDGIHYDSIPDLGEGLARKWAESIFSKLTPQ
jgi:hypothetical protein